MTNSLLPPGMPLIHHRNLPTRCFPLPSPVVWAMTRLTSISAKSQLAASRIRRPCGEFRRLYEAEDPLVPTRRHTTAADVDVDVIDAATEARSHVWNRTKMVAMTAAMPLPSEDRRTGWGSVLGDRAAR